MSKVEMEALDSFHASAADPADLTAGKRFTINAGEADELEKLGLAKPAKAEAARAPAAKRRTTRKGN